jgi:hypothetical protein
MTHTKTPCICKKFITYCSKCNNPVNYHDELLEACKEAFVVMYTQATIEEGHIDACGLLDDENSVLYMLRKAISKAEGK